MIRKICLSICLIAVFSSAAYSDALIEGLISKQKGLKTIKASFTQEKHTKLLKAPIKSKGVFYFKAPSGVRWEYENALTVIYDGKTLYLFYPSLNEAEMVLGAEAFSGPLDFGIEKLRNGYEVSASRDGGVIKLSLKPKGLMPFASIEMRLREDGAFPYEITMEEKSGDRTVLRFSDVRADADIPDSLFRFTAPPGVKIKERKIPK